MNKKTRAIDLFTIYKNKNKIIDEIIISKKKRIFVDERGTHYQKETFDPFEIKCSECNEFVTIRIKNLAFYMRQEKDYVCAYCEFLLLEDIVESYLIVNNIEYKHSVMLGNYRFNFLLKDNTILEVLGDYYHANPSVYTTNNISDRQKFKIEKKNEKESYAVKNGYKVIYLWEKDIMSNDFTKIKNIFEEKPKVRREIIDCKSWNRNSKN